MPTIYNQCSPIHFTISNINTSIIPVASGGCKDAWIQSQVILRKKVKIYDYKDTGS